MFLVFFGISIHCVLLVLGRSNTMCFGGSGVLQHNVFLKFWAVKLECVLEALAALRLSKLAWALARVEGRSHDP